jgi:hypothetical protein
MATQKTMGKNRRSGFSSDTLELLIQERSKGKSLRQLGQMFSVSHEWVRRMLSKHSPSRVKLLPEHRVAAKLGYPVRWLAQLREEGITHPTKPSGRWLYSEEQVKQIPSLIAEIRKCEWCGRPRPVGYRKFCRECSQHRRMYLYYRSLSPEKKTKYLKMIPSPAEGKSRGKVSEGYLGNRSTDCSG